MAKKIEVILTPAEFSKLQAQDLTETVCVVIDVLRATSTMITALANGANEIIPVLEIAEALAIRRQRPNVLLAGERGGFRINAELTGGVEFDLGNSPREFTREKVSGMTIVSTTTNGTRALRACACAKTTLLGAFLNLNVTAHYIEKQYPEDLRLICSGTREEAAYEDLLCAGALCDLVWNAYSKGWVADSAHVARNLYHQARNDLIGAMRHSSNARRLLDSPELRDDVEVCLELDTLPIVAGFVEGESVRRLS